MRKVNSVPAVSEVKADSESLAAKNSVLQISDPSAVSLSSIVGAVFSAISTALLFIISPTENTVVVVVGDGITGA